MEQQRIDLAAARARLAAMKGKTYWRSLDELADTEEFQNFLHREFPEKASEWYNNVSRRSFLRLMGASFALAGLSGCTRQPEEKIVPYAANPPEQFIPGKPVHYATAMPFAGYGIGVLAESHMGRPTKIEGNPQHPASLGASDIFTQASVLDLYDPDRSQAVLNNARPHTWSAFVDDLTREINGQKASQGQGLRLLTGTVTSPSLVALIRQVLAEFPNARWHQYEPVSRDNVREGAKLAFGRYVETRYDLEKADVIVSLDADFLSWNPAKIVLARQFANRRKVRSDKTDMNRLYAIETSPSITGASADHRWAVKPTDFPVIARGLLGGTDVGEFTWMEAIIRDLMGHRGRSVVIAGDNQPAEVHALAHAINQELGNVGVTVFYTEPVEAEPVNQVESIRSLAADMTAGKVELLVILGGNPVFDAPADVDFEFALQKVRFRAHVGEHENETSAWSHWHIPQAHYLESWGDVRAFDGTVSLIQPLIAPLFDGKTASEVLALLLGKGPRKAYDMVRDYWKQNGLGEDQLWQAALHDGVVPGTAAKTIAVKASTPPPGAQGLGEKNLQIQFLPDPSIWDGSFANNGWLQELPKPLTKITWENVALVSPFTAEKLGLSRGDVVEIKAGKGAAELPVWVMPGQAADVVTVHLGFGRTKTGRVGKDAGANVYPLRTSTTAWMDKSVTLAKTGKRSDPATSQNHHLMEGRQLVRTASLDEYKKHPDFAQHRVHLPKEGSLYPKWDYSKGNAWGMAIDLGACIGCNACVVACQSENNIPIVGKDQVARGREMHWLRIDHYFEGDMDNPEMHHQPVACMHCENAPCEVVCPVAATSHSAEGLNEMTYNRCVGTRYCSNNCPYKVRRFNFLQYSDTKSPTLKMLANPDVTVRMRGVMEKCTYCVQRINAVRIDSKKDDRPVRDGEVVTACQGACPAQAISFGNLNDPQAEVTRWKKEPLNYGLLVELNTEPRTSYLAKVKNPNPLLVPVDTKQDAHHGHGHS
jgi:molybdopterin-containing oxidoreductase family iron-sulfur binding subunit